MAGSSKYLEQFNRVKRWYERFAATNEGREHSAPSDYYEDDVYAFFINCHHLEDWIKKDPDVGPALGKVKDFINSSWELSVCADVCNGIKHLKRDREGRSKCDPRFGSRAYELKLGEREQTISVKYSIDTSSGPIDAFELATKCFQAWQNFIESNISRGSTS